MWCKNIESWLRRVKKQLKYLRKQLCTFIARKIFNIKLVFKHYNCDFYYNSCLYNGRLTLQGWELFVSSSGWLWNEAQSFERPASGTVTYKKWPSLETIIVHIDTDAGRAAYTRWNIKIVSHLSHCCWNDPCRVPSEDRRGKCSPDWSWSISGWRGWLGSIHRGLRQNYTILLPIIK